VMSLKRQSVQTLVFLKTLARVIIVSSRPKTVKQRHHLPPKAVGLGIRKENLAELVDTRVVCLVATIIARNKKVCLFMYFQLARAKKKDCYAKGGYTLYQEKILCQHQAIESAQSTFKEGKRHT